MKKLKSLSRLEGEILHSPFYPTEIRDGDEIHADVFLDNTWKALRVWRYSPFGVEVVLTNDTALEPGAICKLKLRFVDDELIFDGVKVATISDENIGKIAGFRIFTKREAQPVTTNRRQTVRWTCSDTFLPTGTAPNPMKFNDHMIFRVENISAGGMRLLTSMRNKLLYQGIVLETSISLPLVGSISTPIKVEYLDVVTRGEDQLLSIGASFVKPTQFIMSCLAEYLLHFGQDVTVASLIKDGFPLKSNDKTLDFSYVKTKFEYDQVLQLRTLAYSKAGKIDSEAQSKEMADIYDARARVLMVKKGDSVVGSIRVMFHEKYEDSELFLDGVSNVPNVRHEEAVEISRLCTNPEFRGIDIAYNLLTHMYLTAVKAGKRYVYGGATGTLVELYKTLGWQFLDITYECGSLKGIPHRVFYVDIYEAVLGRGVKPRAWKKVYKSLYDYLYEREAITPTPYDLMKIQLYNLLP